MLLLHPKMTLLYMLLCVVWMVLNINLRHITLPYTDRFSPGSIRSLGSRNHLNQKHNVVTFEDSDVTLNPVSGSVYWFATSILMMMIKMPGQSETPQIIVEDKYYM